ncbi:MAG: transcriptional regulator, partial [Clostridia bacterium]|nr:transcriptional regulator [Clostridia bacterium]
VAKSLARDRRKTMQGMKLWEKRKKAVKTPA